MGYLEYKAEVVKNIEKDGMDKAELAVQSLCHKRNGKFKISEKQFIEEMTNMWVSGELSGAERVLRLLESDPDLTTKDLIRGEIHVLLINIYKIAKRRMSLKKEFALEDFLYGKYTTEEVMRARGDLV